MKKIARIVSFTWQTLDPFIFCVHHLDKYPQYNPEKAIKDSSLTMSDLRGRDIGSDFSYLNGFSMYHGTAVPGFPAHPHCGFETITAVLKGVVDHHDSLGTTVRYGEGDCQILTTGNGIQHSEMFPLVHEDKPNTMELFQIWLNTPASLKVKDASFSMAWKETQPIKTLSDGHVRVLVGDFDELTGPRAPRDSYASVEGSHVSVVLIELNKKGAQYVIPAMKETINRQIYVYEGAIKETTSLGEGSFAIELDSQQNVSIVSESDVVKILLLQGKPINEPIAQRGPFVANSQDGLKKMMQKYQATQFGGRMTF